ncbi:cell division protein FtsA [Oecophyllibacter saccharovorans]|uniref:Cell division protein FtsA n=1 Tax=Oecophyllibacter saccharovorans TaxID=2558360 RepID=A0A506URB1_9PROT|nr:cell division protein FtsA [Oecophyllibacter saccharovorans]QDH14672.1 cell division protein FtsA [Oecophyllibacter saccharovorans]TPW34872.1 cell division protein FtsA [Oecophyllibacter saccharovorans]TPW35809.1 cell division protein FtsA [Oecophyllibacter saccharovorans]
MPLTPQSESWSAVQTEGFLAPETPADGRAVLPLLPEERPPGFEWRTGIKAVLDLGSTKATCLIGRALSNGSLQVLGWGWRRSEGINSGAIIDTRRVEAVIRATVGDAEKQAGRRIDELVLNLSCGNPQSYHIDTEMMIGGREVTLDDVRDLLDDARYRAFHEDRRLVHTLPLGFNVDETPAVPNPCGHQCNHLLGKFHLIDANTSALRTLSTVLHRADLRLSGLVSSPFASGLAVLDHDERDLGVTVVEMGAGTTSLAVFSHGRLLYTAQLRVGGHHITRDIASALSVHTDTAEWLKTMHGAAQPVSDDDHHIIPLPAGQGTGMTRLPRSKLVSIIAPRIEETLEMTRHALESANLGRLTEGRVVLTGGASLLNDLGPVAARIFGRQVRLGQPRGIHNLPENSTISAGFSTAAGLLAWSAGAEDAFCLPEENTVSRGPMKRLVNLIRRHV